MLDDKVIPPPMPFVVAPERLSVMKKREESRTDIFLFSFYKINTRSPAFHSSCAQQPFLYEHARMCAHLLLPSSPFFYAPFVIPVHIHQMLGAFSMLLDGMH